MKAITSYIFLVTIFIFYSFAAYPQLQWIDSVKKALPKQGEDTNKVWTYIGISGAYTFNYPDSGFTYGQKALDLAEKLQFDRGIFWSIVTINKSLYVLGNYALELDYAFRAFPLGIKLNDPFTLGWANGMVGDCYFNLGDYNTSLSFYRKALKTAEENSIIDLFSLYSFLTPVLVNLKQFDTALLYAKKGYKLFKNNPALNIDNFDNKVAKSHLFRFLGEAYTGKANYDSALIYYRMSLSICHETQNELNMIDVYNDIANVFKLKGNLDSALYYSKRVLSRKITKIYPVAMLKAANLLAEIYELKESSDSTLKYLHIALNTQDSLFNKQKMMAYQNIIFKEQEKQKEIAAARSRLQDTYRRFFSIAFLIIFLTITGIFIKIKRQKQLQKIRNGIADDLHDDIGSALSSIGIMSELAKKQSPESLSLLASIGESSSAVQENMSDIVWTITSKNDRFENVVQRMRLFAEEILEAKNIELDFVGDSSLSDTRLSMGQRKNCYLFFKEVINNSAKYSEAKKVTVRISKKDRHIEMNISDNGIGFEISQSSDGNGMDTLKKRAAELHADFKISSILNKGTDVRLKFKIGAFS